MNIRWLGGALRRAGMGCLRRCSLLPEHLPAVVFIELVDIMFAPLMPVIVIGVMQFSIGVLVAGRNNDAVTMALTVAELAVTVARVLLIIAYRRRQAMVRLDAQEAGLWELRYTIGSLAFAVLLGALCARALSVNDPLAPMLATALVFGYGAGVVTRQSVRPVLCMASLSSAVAPVAVAFVSHTGAMGGAHGEDVYIAQALVLVIFTIAGLQTVSYAYRTTLQQLMTKQDLAILAGQDALTGLPNRITLRARFADGAATSGGTGLLQALHCLDLDRFKAVNDIFGHPMGDALLRAVAERLARALQAGDTASRVGGDEFVVLQTGIRHADEARLLASRLIRVIGAPYGIDGQDIRIGVSIGIALAPRDGIALGELTSRADQALYRAKRERPGSIVFWDDAALPPAKNSMAGLLP